MKYINLLFLALIFSSITFSSCKQNPKGENSNLSKEVKNENKLIESQEFKDYFQVFFKLSDRNTKVDLPYVNNFMKENKLWQFKNICDLLENEKIKADPRVFKYWKIRCDFQNTRTTLMEKYNINSDSLKIIMEHAVSDPPESLKFD